MDCHSLVSISFIQFSTKYWHELLQILSKRLHHRSIKRPNNLHILQRLSIYPVCHNNQILWLKNTHFINVMQKWTFSYHLYKQLYLRLLTQAFQWDIIDKLDKGRSFNRHRCTNRYNFINNNIQKDQKEQTIKIKSQQRLTLKLTSWCFFSYKQ